MINNAIMAVNLFAYDNRADDNPQDALNSHDHIEIDDNITNFEQLQQQQNFKLIREQYKKAIKSLEDLYYFFTGIECKESVAVSINNIYSTDTNHQDLFYSYTKTRKYIMNIVSYLALCKENHLTNDHTTIICEKLTECFGFCLQGFNSKITDINEYILIFNSKDFQDQISIKIKKLLQETIVKVLIEKYNNKQSNIISSNVHTQNAFFNLIADKLNLEPIIDQYASLNYITASSITNIVKTVQSRLSAFNIHNYIANYLYEIFTDCLATIGKTQWLNNSIMQDLLATDIEHIENAFIGPINKYLCLEVKKDTLKIADIFIKTEEIGCFYLAMVKDVLNDFLARNINKIINISPDINQSNNLIINIDKNTNIYNIYDCYFYVIDENIKRPLTLDYFLTIKLTDAITKIHIPMFICALDNTKEAAIHDFFNYKSANNLIFANKDIAQELTQVIQYNNNLGQKLLNALVNPHIKQQTITDITMLSQFISNDILTKEIIESLVDHAVDISQLLQILTAEQMHTVISVLGKEAIFKILNHYQEITKVTNEIYEMFYQTFDSEKTYQCIKRLNKNFITDFLMYLGVAKRKLLFKDIFNTNYKLARLFIPDLIKLHNLSFLDNLKLLSWIDPEKNSILHYVIKNQDEATLNEIMQQLGIEIIKQWQQTKNNQGNTPLMLAVTQSNNLNIITRLLENYNTMELQNYLGETALIRCVVNNKPEYLALLLGYSDASIINKQNHEQFNALMLAAGNGYLNCLDCLLSRDDISLYETTIDIHGDEIVNKNNSLMLALKNKHDACGVSLIEKYNQKMLLQQNYYGCNALKQAAEYNNINSLKKILATCDHNTIMQARNTSCNDSLMLSIINGNSACTKELLKIFTTSDLNKTNGYGENALNLAISYNSPCLEEIIVLSTKHQITKTSYSGDNALSLACYHGLDSRIINILIQKSDFTAGNNYSDFDQPLIRAASQGHLECIKILAKYLTPQQLLDTTDKRRNNCLDIAVKNNYYECVEYLINTYKETFKKASQTQKIKNLAKNNRMKKILGL